MEKRRLKTQFCQMVDPTCYRFREEENRVRLWSMSNFCNFSIETITRRPLTSRIFSVQSVVATAHFWGSRVANARLEFDEQKFWHCSISAIPLQKKTHQERTKYLFVLLSVCVTTNLYFFNNFEFSLKIFLNKKPQILKKSSYWKPQSNLTQEMF